VQQAAAGEKRCGGYREQEAGIKGHDFNPLKMGMP